MSVKENISLEIEDMLKAREEKIFNITKVMKDEKSQECQEISIDSLKDELRRLNAEKKELEQRLQNALEAENAMHQLYLQTIILRK